MKIIRDQTVFRWEPLPPPNHFHEMEFFHIRSRRSYRMRGLPAGSGGDLLRCDCICEVDLRRGAHYLRRYAPFLSIEYVKQGTLLVRQRGNAYELTDGECFIMQPEIESEFLSGDGGCRKISVMVTGELLKPFLATGGLGEIDVVRHLDSRHAERLFQELNELADESADDVSLRNSQLTFELLQSLRQPLRPPEVPPVLAGLLAGLRAHPEHDWTQAEMAGRCGCCGNHLVRLFRRHLGVTPKQHLLALRMQRARELLAAGELSIKEISNRCGYGNALNFSTEFRKRFGMSPRSYRRQLSFFS